MINTMAIVMQYCNNYFYDFKEVCDFSISTNSIKVKGRYIAGQYIRIMGSVLNDGIYKIDSIVDNTITITGLIDEDFAGCIVGLKVPKAFISLVEGIHEYRVNNKPSDNAIVSESFGQHSYSKATNNKGNVMDWVDLFKSEISPYKRIYDGLRNVRGV